MSSPHTATMLDAWQMKDFEPGAGVPARAFDCAQNADGWIAVSAPGDTYVALHAAGRLPDPFGDRMEDSCAWVRDREWWWRTTFESPQVDAGERLVLAFDGLDTFAEIWLNGEIVATSDNMFSAVVLDITTRARQANTLAVRFTPPAVATKDKTPPTWPPVAASLNGSKRNIIRKAQFGWGWDWGPDLPTVGIWRPVTLAVKGRAELTGIAFTTLACGRGEATARIRIAVEARGEADGIALELVDPDGRMAIALTLARTGEVTVADCALPEPQLWWTHDLGAPAVYTLRAALRDGDRVVDTREIRVGIRTIALDRSADADEPGTEFFRFVLNGVPVFARGACWIPASSFVGALRAEDYRRLIDDAADANMNMLRVWGGGIYEHDVFYNECDARGILVWQDFMFACAPTPEDDPEFVQSVEGELRCQVRRLRHHPSLALWCGNNEAQMMHSFLPREERAKALPGALYYNTLMPQVVAALDPSTPYWPGSPAGGPHANSMRAGDVHDWTVWHGVPPVPDDRPVGTFDRSDVAYTRYAEDMGRFVSEFGIQASPAMETLKRAVPADQLHLHSPGMEARIKDTPKDKVNALLGLVTGLPRDLQQYVDFTQIAQGEGLKFGIEHFRRRMPHCSGALIWQFNDCWPCVSWSLVDYNGFAKAAYFHVRRAYAPVLASFKALEDGGVELWITNESPDDLDDIACTDLATFSGKPVWTQACAVRVAANTSRAVWRAAKEEIGPAPDRFLHVESRGGAFGDNRLFFAPIKDLARPRDAKPAVTIAQKGAHALDVRIEAPAYLYFAHILTPHAGTKFSDNYFDLRAGRVRSVTVTNESVALRPEDITVRSC
jgi:beta-mannosidase